MVLMPKRVKYRKLQKGQRRGLATTGATLAFGEFGLKCLGNGKSMVEIEQEEEN